MRFALIAASIATAIAAPLAVAAAGPQMSSDQFIAAVRCTAIEQVTRPQLELGAVKMRLNSEARRQDPETAAAARAEVLAIAREAAAIANSEESAMMRQERVETCAGGQSA